MRGRLIAIVAVLAVLAGGGLAWELRGNAGPAATPTPTASVSATSSPSPSPSPAPSLAAIAVAPPAGTPPSGRGIAAALASALADRALGSRVAVLVADATGDALYERAADTLVVPASTAKLATALAALQVLDPGTRLATRAVSAATPSGGVLAGDLVLVGGGDPTLTRTPARSGYPRPAALSDLARAVARSGVRRITGRILADGTLFTGPRLGPAWKPTYVTEGSVAPVTALEVDGGRIPRRDARQQQPDLAAARDFRAELAKAGVAVGPTVARGTAPLGGTELGRVESPPVAALAERVLVRSDNDLAEALGRHVALALGQPADFAGAARAVASVVDTDGLKDSSGLSPQNRISPRGLVALLRLAATQARLRRVLAALPVAGFTGTLANRYDRGTAAAAAGWVRAKTGSLDNVSTLAGFVQTRSGQLLLFAFAADRLPTRFTSAAARALDVAAAALARCGCG